MPAVDPKRDLTTALVGIQQEIRRLWAAVHGGAAGGRLLGVGQVTFEFAAMATDGNGHFTTAVPTITTTGGDIDMAATYALSRAYLTYANSGTPALYVVTASYAVFIPSAGAQVTDVFSIQLFGCDPATSDFASTWVNPLSTGFTPSVTSMSVATASATDNPQMLISDNLVTHPTAEGGLGAGSNIQTTLTVARFALPA